MSEGSDLAIREERGLDFRQVVDSAREKAQILKAIVDQAHLSTQIGNSNHLNVEAWQTIARGYGYTPKIEWTRLIAAGGWEARAVVLDALGAEVSSGEAECGTEGDDNWIGRASFQQRSMAQTRAVSKALRVCLSWVVVLAGFSATPSEEMTGDEKSFPDRVLSASGSPLWRINNLKEAPRTGGPFWCQKHQANWFKRGTMRGFAHPLDGGAWCNMPKDAPPAPADAEPLHPQPDPEEPHPADEE